MRPTRRQEMLVLLYGRLRSRMKVFLKSYNNIVWVTFVRMNVNESVCVPHNRASHRTLRILPRMDSDWFQNLYGYEICCTRYVWASLMVFSGACKVTSAFNWLYDRTVSPITLQIFVNRTYIQRTKHRRRKHCPICNFILFSIVCFDHVSRREKHDKSLKFSFISIPKTRRHFFFPCIQTRKSQCAHKKFTKHKIKKKSTFRFFVISFCFCFYAIFFFLFFIYLPSFSCVNCSTNILRDVCHLVGKRFMDEESKREREAGRRNFRIQINTHELRSARTQP